VEISGAGYLYNLSVMAITFTAVSTLVMLVRQTLGGKLSSFDIFLIKAFVSFGFAVAIGAVLPPLLAMFELPAVQVWLLASAAMALLLAVILVSVAVTRHRVSRSHLPPIVAASYLLHAAAVVLLAVNAAAPAVRGLGLFAAALTRCLANTMWAFVRRITSLLGDKPSGDWDLRRG
jgi:hypothetical protein